MWEGGACSSAADCSGTAKLAWRDDTLYVLVQVKDDVIGARLPASDCKRHWRTDSVEVTLDPRGRSENTSTTFKTAVLPVTAEGPPCVLRDADNRQGPGAPGTRVASSLSSGAYTVEMAIPMEALPGAVDPSRLGLNVLVYDSDTQDKTGQTRIGWSTWGGVQGDPYRWGIATPARIPAAARTADHPARPGDPRHRAVQPGLPAVAGAGGPHRPAASRAVPRPSGPRAAGSPPPGARGTPSR
ncbi:sugar-binding protein [Nonomuraea dietziae]|uniref:sugar-binding protein n=1 Tax=Nonomuraea dietziae TaxID=65515 RepID=UPI0031D5F2CD